MSTKTERARERNHSALRHVENELHNTLTDINQLVGRVAEHVHVRDCKTARLNFDQAAIAFRGIGAKLKKATELHRKLKIVPGRLGDQGKSEIEVGTFEIPKTPPAAKAKKPAKAKKAAPKKAPPKKKGKR